MNSIKISVITAVYNSKETLSDTIESTLGQLHPDVELLVIDGASTDGSLAVIERFRDQINVLLSEPDRGIYDALNKGLSLASGEVIGFLHSDDVFSDQNVLVKIAAVFEDPAVDAVYGDLTYVSKADTKNVIRYWKSGEFYRSRLFQGWMPPHPTFYARRSIYEQNGYFDTSFRIAADYDCMLRFLGKAAISVRYIPEVLVCMRVGGESNRSIKNIIRKSMEDFRALRKNGIGGFSTLLLKNLRKVPQFFKRG